jgi:DNA-binding PadR family transcriptional regulator
MTKGTIKSTLGFAILGLISQKPRTGYDLRKVFATTPMGHFSSSPGAIYPALKRFEEDGLIEGTVKGKDTMRPRRVYMLTEKGKEALRQRLSQPVTQDDIIWHMDDIMLRFAFIGDILGREETLNFLKELLQQIEDYIPFLEEHLGITSLEESPYGAFAMEHGVETYKTTARWARSVINRLQDNKVS